MMVGIRRKIGALTRPGLFGALLVLGACTTALPPDKVPSAGDAFTEALRQGYVRLAAADRQRGGFSYRHYDAKARQAMLGDVVLPDRVADRKVATPFQAEAIEWRNRLLDVLEADARRTMPEEAALAQVNFDCWLTDLRLRPGAESECKDRFITALERVEVAMAEGPATYSVLFDAGSAFLSADALDEITRAARISKLRRSTRIEVIGYADPSGSAQFNQALSEKRAQAVVKVLQRAGVPADIVQVEARGAPPAGADPRSSRRVDIVLAG